MCRILAANIIISGSENDWESIPNDIESIFRITNHCSEQPFYINKLVAIASMWQAHDVTRRLLINPDELPGAGIIRRILDKFNQFGFLCDFDGSFEKYAIKDLIQHCYSENVQGDGVLTKEGIYIAGIWANTQMQEDLYKRQLKWLGLTGDYASIFTRPEFMNVILPLIQKESPGRIEITQYLMQLWELAEISANAPLWKLNEYMDQWEKNGKMEYQGAVIEAPSTDNLGHLLWFYEHITPGKMAMRPVLNRTNHDNTRLILALHGYYREEGHWPEALSDLVPGWLREVPLDASTGKPLIYRVENGKPLIYGRGYDGVDDGGQFDGADKPGFHWNQQPSDTGDWLIWPVPVIPRQDTPTEEFPAGPVLHTYPHRK